MTVAIVSTGGTIASTTDGDGGARPTLSAESLVDAIPAVADVTPIETTQFSTVPSTHLTLDQMAGLLDFVEAADEDATIDGVVITQGTDVLEETSWFVDCAYTGETPVVFTGAMRNPSLPSPDGPANLLASIRVAADPAARDRGVLVAFNDRVLPAAAVTKTHSMNPDTFRAPEYGPLATIAEDRVRWRRTRTVPRPGLSIDPDRLTTDVPATYVTAAMSDRSLRACTDVPALCLATTGAGHVPPDILPALEALRANDVPIVATTRCPEGVLARDTYDFEGSERTLRELGCYFSDHNLQKTRIATIVALSADGLDTMFDRPAPPA